jgi:pyridoxamine 5'-phosphate oxidase
MTALPKDILDRMRTWLDEGREQTGLLEPTAMVLATVAADGTPSARVVLLKEVDERGLVFYTNYESDKGRDLAQNPRAALNFHWDAFRRQLRVQGDVVQVDAAESDAYFASRPVGSQIGAWASEQSRPLDRYETLMQRAGEFMQKFQGGEVPRPPHWGGYRVIPERVEFWSSKDDRLHQRDLHVRGPDGWTASSLFP